MTCWRSSLLHYRPFAPPPPFTSLVRRCGNRSYKSLTWQPASRTTHRFIRHSRPFFAYTSDSTFPSKLEPLQSGVGTTTLLTLATAAVVFSAASVAAWFWTSADDPIPIDPSDTTGDHEPTTRADGPPFHLPAGMLTSPTYGRPGYLTPEQEIKFKELWLQILSLTGYTTQENGKPSDTASIAASSVKKKRRFGSLRRSRGPEDDIADPEDKYGQSKEFKQALADQTPEQLADTMFRMSKHDSPDGLVLRYLRARKWNVHNALVMLISTVHWRGNEAKVEETIMQRGEHGALEDAQSSDPNVRREGEDFLTQFRKGKSYLHGCDKDGRPVCVINVRFHHAGEQTQSSLERYTIYTIETGRLLLVPPVDTATLLFDMTDFGRANMDYTPVKFMIKCFEANYPESLGRVMVHNAPWLFQGIWAVIKGWLDPVVASKINFTKGPEQLAEFIPMEHIPKGMGGKEDWEFKYVEPLPNENNGMSDTATRDKLLVERRQDWDELMRETVRWCRGEGDTKAVTQRRDELIEKLRVNYWKLDPYVRARSWYDRTGVLGPDGKVDFHPHMTTVDADAMSVASGESVYYDAKTEQDEE